MHKNSKNWLDQSERGSLLAMKALAWVTLNLGRSFGRIFLLPICIYFILFSFEARRSSVDYLRRVLPRRPRWHDVLRHYHAFASTIHDRLYMLTGQYQYFDVHVHGYHEVADYMRGQGCILMGSHLGSFEVLRTLGMFKQSLAINVLMHATHADKLNSILDALNPGIKPSIIAMGQPDTLLKVHECIQRKEIVGMLGDRTFTSDKRVICDFLGDKITLPQGPLAVAAILDVPVILFFGLYRGGKRYDLHFELFEASPAVERSLRTARINEWAQRYAERLEHYCRLAPYNWFNFYRYWNE
jgi:predicted LPLAT superfamily acyltransferase